MAVIKLFPASPFSQTQEQGKFVLIDTHKGSRVQRFLNDHDVLCSI
jgi:hypothetical protein